MKNIKNKALVVLSIAFLVVSLIFSVVVTADTLQQFKTGDKFYYGSYPQSKVTDTHLIDQLNQIDEQWVSYNYFAEGKASDFMKYKDVTYNGNKYRGVLFAKYRPNITYAVADAQNSYQDENGYKTNVVYWFKFEPIEWKVLYPSTGLVLSSIILDSQSYRNTFYIPDNNFEEFYTDKTMKYYANNYEVSDIRKWLSENFINTAFSPAQQKNILVSDNFNNAWNSSDPLYSKYNANKTQDKVYLLTNGDCSDTRYGFPTGGAATADRQFKGSDYAKSQGLGVYKGNGDVPRYSFLWSRTAGTSSSAVTGIDYLGYTYHRSYSVLDTHFGVMPAMKIDLSAINK